MSRRSRRWALVVASLLLVTAPCAAAAQEAVTPAIKAAFLLNFVKFSEWPADAAGPGAPLVLCVAGDREVLSFLEQLTAKGAVGGREVVVKGVKVDDSLGSCHLFYVSGVDENRASAVARSLEGRPVLGVSDSSGFAESGGSINFEVENAKMRFVINRDAVARSRLRLSSKLMSLARVVTDR